MAAHEAPAGRSGPIALVACIGTTTALLFAANGAAGLAALLGPPLALIALVTGAVRVREARRRDESLRAPLLMLTTGVLATLVWLLPLLLVGALAAGIGI